MRAEIQPNARSVLASGGVSFAAHARLQVRRPVPAHGRPAAGDRPDRGRPRARRPPPDAAGRDRHRQDRDARLDDRALPEADARPRPQQDARRAALQRVPGVLPGQRRRVLRQLLRLLPAGGVPAPERHLHREGLVTERRDRPPPPRRDPRPLRATRRDHRRQRLVHLRPGRAGRLRRDGRPPPEGRLVPPRRRPPPARRPPVPAQRPVPDPGPLPGPRRHARVPAGVGGPPRPGRVLRRRRRADHRARPARPASCSPSATRSTSTPRATTSPRPTR